MSSNTGRADLRTSDWRISSASDGNHDCVEVRPVDGRVLVRDSKNRVTGRVLSFAGQGWRTLVAGL